MTLEHLLRSRPACASLQSGQDLHYSHTQYTRSDLVEDIGLDQTCDCANWYGASPFVYALRVFLSASGLHVIYSPLDYFTLTPVSTSEQADFGHFLD